MRFLHNPMNKTSPIHGLSWGVSEIQQDLKNRKVCQVSQTIGVHGVFTQNPDRLWKCMLGD